MKVLLYSEGQNIIKNSGIGKTREHQLKALRMYGVDVTFQPNEPHDIVHINTTGPRSRHLARKSRQSGTPVVYHAHSTEEDFRNSFIGSNLFSPGVKKWFISCYTSGDVIITPTPYSKKLLENYGIQTPIYTVSNGVDLEFFRPSAEKKDAFRRQFGFTHKDKVILGVGLYIERKGILDFVEMSKRLPQYQFIWFGHTPLYSIPAKIRRIVRAKYQNLSFPGYVDSNVLSTAYCGADLFWFPTFEETEGIVLLEAMAAKQNVLVRNIPIYAGWMKDGKDVYKGNSSREFEQKIVGILENKLPDLTENAYELVNEKSIENVGKQLKNIYLSLLHKY